MQELGMLPSDLAKQLLDAGYPQGGDGKWFIPPGAVAPVYYVPTAEELIAACGDALLRIERHDNELGVYWIAEGSAKGFCSGSTLKEALARLWLASAKC